MLRMINLVKNQTNNNIALTLTELSELSNPFYIFEFTNDTTNVKYLFISEDLSNNKQRYNLFNITEGVDDVMNGSVVLGDTGFYKYKIYESETETLEVEGLNVVEIGKVKLIGEKQEFARQEQTTTFKTYE